jgi:hypothetical protein
MSREKHRVAIVVFAECEGADYHDAAVGAQMSLNHLLREGGILGREFKTLPSPPRRDGHSWETTIHHVMEVGMAAGNGYLWTEPTSKAFPREDWE